ncbi:flagellar basal-body MS-ring/collar protein FliF [Ahrensia kielensis]|uniref:Flagellar M-ring protein n=1 Tax=Ahrensia kielensis TaxID=76980 RepID=A0ABU9T8N0_9HYPH
MLNQFNQFMQNVGALGIKKLAILGGIGIGTMAIVLFGALYVNKPVNTTLYVNLERDDIGRMGIVLSDAGIKYDVNAEGSALMVPVGDVSRARMVLAEKGLPSGSSTGYELFDDLGSLGLTAFMQEITRVRALEGEVARSIQTIEGVRAARVHIVMAEQGNFRRAEQAPTASVIVRYDGSQAQQTAMSIRHLVSSAVPSLSTENVTVLDSAGRVLAAGEDPLRNSAGNNLGIKSSVEGQVVNSIERALTPYLGSANFRVSVQADINTDQRQTEETIFDPDSRVERSVQVVRSENSSAQSAGGEPATVEQDLIEEVPGSGGANESERSERREETTNYELNSKRIAVVSNGYEIGRLSVAVVVNKAAMLEQDPDMNDAQLEEKLAEIRSLVAAASGTLEARNDIVELTAVNFLPVEQLVATSEEGIATVLSKQLGTAINAIAFLGAVILVVMFAVRPALRTLSNPETPQVEDFAMESAGGLPDFSLDEPSMLDQDFSMDDFTNNNNDPERKDLLARMAPEPADRIAMIVDLDEKRAAAILRRWVTEVPA